jgi:hypothetical protein
MIVDPQDWCRVWYEIGKLQGIVEELQRDVKLLKGNGTIIDNTPEPSRTETHGNIICLPGVTLNRPGKGRTSRKGPPATAIAADRSAHQDPAGQLAGFLFEAFTVERSCPGRL